MWSLYLVSVFNLLTYALAFTIRDAQSNVTTTQSSFPTQTQLLSAPVETIPSSDSRRLKPHFESTENGFGSPITTSFLRNVQTTAPPKDGVASAIHSFLITAMPLASFQSYRVEQSVDGWQEVSTDNRDKPRIEVTADGFDRPTPTHRYSEGPREKSQLVDSLPNVTPPPAIIWNGVTVQPIPITNVKVTSIDGKPTTVAAAVNYRYVVGTATLSIGTPMTINNVVVGLKIGTAGSTVLVAGDQTTTLSAPAGGNQVTQGVSFATTVIDGTTKYILGGQTLAPGQGVTVGEIPISIGTRDGNTILVMGNTTTTFAEESITTSSGEKGTSVLVSVGATNKPTSTSTKAEAPSAHTMNRLLSQFLAMAAIIQQLV